MIELTYGHDDALRKIYPDWDDNERKRFWRACRRREEAYGGSTQEFYYGDELCRVHEIPSKEDIAKHREEHRKRSDHIRILKQRLAYLNHKVDDLGIKNLYITDEIKALEYVLEKFKDGTI